MIKNIMEIYTIYPDNQEQSSHLNPRLDVFIFKKLSVLRTDISRMYVQKLIQDGYIFENEIAILSCAKKINSNYVYKAKIPLIKISNVKIAKSDDLSVAFEDEYLAILNKPAFLTVHSGIGVNIENTLAGMLNKIFKNMNFENQDDRNGIVHRLDRDTSGLIMVAKTEDMQRVLSNMIQKKMVERSYIAIVHGVPFNRDGIIDINIKHSRNNRAIMATSQNGGKNAITHYKTLEILEMLDDVNNKMTISIIECTLDTGRTHQIRVHMKHILCPILGDKKYGITTNLIDRQALHSYKMSFIHPITNESICIKSKLPEDMEGLLQLT